MSPAASLLAWYKKHGRRLPWRDTRDAYRILVSEIMLQQTQVTRVTVFYDRWLCRFPTWDDLAKASNADVIQAWAGLGYNRRALLLRDIAKQVVACGLPQSEIGWRALKGIGPYTAAALSNFSLHERALPIDTNIRRVIGRALLGIPYPDLKDDAAILSVLDRFTPTTGNFYDVPQALFDLATSTCTKTTPACVLCPLKTVCLAQTGFEQGSHALPAKDSRKPIERIHAGKKFPDRIFRGRILKLVREQPHTWNQDTLGPAIDPAYDSRKDSEWVYAMVKRLIKDQLLRTHDGFLEI